MYVCFVSMYYLLYQSGSTYSTIESAESRVSTADAVKFTLFSMSSQQSRLVFLFLSFYRQFVLLLYNLDLPLDFSRRLFLVTLESAGLELCLQAKYYPRNTVLSSHLYSRQQSTPKMSHNNHQSIIDIFEDFQLHLTDEQQIREVSPKILILKYS